MPASPLTYLFLAHLHREDCMVYKVKKNTVYSFGTNPGRLPAEKADISIPTNAMVTADYLD